MWSQHKRRFYRQLGCSEVEIQEKERVVLVTKAKPDSPLVEEIYRLATSRRPVKPNAISEMVNEKLTKALPPPKPHAPIISRLMQRGAMLL